MGVAIAAEVLESPDRHDAVDGLVEPLPALEKDSPVAARVHLVKRALHVGRLIRGQGQPDDIDVVLLDGAPHGGAPPAADVQQHHARLQLQLPEREVDLGDLRLF